MKFEALRSRGIVGKHQAAKALECLVREHGTLLLSTSRLLPVEKQGLKAPLSAEGPDEPPISGVESSFFDETDRGALAEDQARAALRTG